AAGQYMVNAAESDIVSPSVTTEDPLGFLRQEVFVLHDVLAGLAVASLKSSYQFVGGVSVGHAAVEGIQVRLACFFYFCGSLIRSGYSLYFFFQSRTDGFLSKQHTVTKLCVILKQGVGPCRTLSL